MGNKCLSGWRRVGSNALLAALAENPQSNINSLSPVLLCNPNQQVSPMNFTVARWPENAEGCAQCRVAAGHNGFERRVRDGRGTHSFSNVFCLLFDQEKVGVPPT